MEGEEEARTRLASFVKANKVNGEPEEVEEVVRSVVTTLEERAGGDRNVFVAAMLFVAALPVGSSSSSTSSSLSSSSQGRRRLVDIVMQCNLAIGLLGTLLACLEGVVLAGLGREVGETLQRSIGILRQGRENGNALFAKFKTLWSQAHSFVFSIDQENNRGSQLLFDISWLLFAISRHDIFVPDYFDPSELYHLQIAVVHSVLVHQESSISSLSDGAAGSVISSPENGKRVRVEPMMSTIMAFLNYLHAHGGKSPDDLDVKTILEREHQVKEILSRFSQQQPVTSQSLFELRAYKHRLRDYLRDTFILNVHDFDESLLIDFENSQRLAVVGTPGFSEAGVSAPPSTELSSPIEIRPCVTPPLGTGNSKGTFSASTDNTVFSAAAMRPPPGIALEHQKRRRTASVALSPKRSPTTNGGESAADGLTPARKLFGESETTSSSDDIKVGDQQQLTPKLRPTEIRGRQRIGSFTLLASSATFPPANGGVPPPSPPIRAARTPGRILRSPAGTLRPFDPSQTPFSSAVEVTSWLRRELENAPASPSDYLGRFFQESLDPVNPLLEKMRQRVLDEYELCISSRSSSPRRLFLSIPSQNGDNTSQSNSEQEKKLLGIESQFTTGVKVFYRVLENILRVENEKLKDKADVSDLLRNEVFIRSLFACSLEIVLRAKHTFVIMFPKLLDILEVSAVDLVRMIGYFVEYLPSIHPALLAHLTMVEENALLDVIWRSSSPIHEIMSTPCRSPTARNAETFAGASSTPTRGSVAGVASTPPFSSNFNSLDIVSEAFSQGLLPAPTKALLKKKLARLAEERISKLCITLDLSSEVASAATGLALKTTQNGVSFIILCDRHFDHVLLCSIYSVCKLSVPVSFQALIGAYQVLRPNFTVPNQSSMSDMVDFKAGIALENPTLKGNIVEFYNRVFLPHMKAQILEFKAKFPTMPPSLLLPPILVSDSTSSSSGVLSSPSRPDRALQATMTPITRSLYAIGTPLTGAKPPTAAEAAAAAASSFRSRLKFGGDT